MKLLLDTYKGLAKEQRDKVQVCIIGNPPSLSMLVACSCFYAVHSPLLKSSL